MPAPLDTNAAVSPARIARAWGLAALWMLFVWGLGRDDLSLESTSRLLGPLFRFLFPWISEATNEQLQWAVRKTAHLIEYAVMSLLLLRAMWLSDRPRGGMALLCAFAIAAGLAAADETRQSLSAARLGSWADVVLDAAGAGLGVAALVAARKRWPAACARLGIPPPLAPPTDRNGEPE